MQCQLKRFEKIGVICNTNADKIWLKYQSFLIVKDIKNLSQKNNISLEDLKQIIKYEESFLQFLLIWVTNIEKYMRTIFTGFYITRDQKKRNIISQTIKKGISNNWGWRNKDKHNNLIKLPTEKQIHNCALSTLTVIFLKAGKNNNRLSNEFYEFLEIKDKSLNKHLTMIIKYRNTLLHSYNFLFTKERISIKNHFSLIIKILKLIYHKEKYQKDETTNKFLNGIDDFSLLKGNSYKSMKKIFGNKFITIKEEKYLRQYLNLKNNKK